MARIDDFELITKLGEGGMGAVYKARQVSLDRIVALKILAKRLAGDNSFVTRFLREARATAKLNHPNIVSGIAVGSADGYHYFAMEFIEGETLNKRLKTSGAIPEAEALRIGAAVASALAHAHSLGIIHRDVKPDNIMMMSDGTPKLADLGLAKGNESEEDASLTQAGTALGTPHYIAPEQAAGEADIDGRADTYALGCTLYHLATGQTPFQAPTTAVLMMKHMTEKMPHPQSLKPQLSDGFCLILSRMVARDRADRYADLKAAAADMETLIAGGQPEIKPLPANKSKFQPAPGQPKFQRRTGKHAPIDAGSGETASTERSGSRQPTATRLPSQRVEVPAGADHKPLIYGVVGFVVVATLGYVLIGGGSKPVAKSPEAQPPPAIPEPKNTPPPPAPPKPPVAAPAPRPATQPSTPNPHVVAAPAKPTAGFTPLLQNGDLSSWKIVEHEWTAADSVLTGKGLGKNACIWKFNSLPPDFELRFEVEDTRAFHLGYTTEAGASIFVNMRSDRVIRLHKYSTPVVELDMSKAKYPPGRYAWKIVVKGESVKVYINDAIAAEHENANQRSARKRGLCLYAAPGSVVHYSNLEVRDLSK